MFRLRVSISGLMLAVLLVAADIGVFQELSRRPDVDCGKTGAVGNSLPLEVFTLGVLPLGTLLLVMGWEMARGLREKGTFPTFGLGFQVGGWLSILLFVGWSVLWPRGVCLYLQLLFDPAAGWLESMIKLIPVLVLVGIEWLLLTLILATPGLGLALLGGWLAQRGGVSIVVAAPTIALASEPQPERSYPDSSSARAATP